MNHQDPQWFCVRTVHKHEHLASASLRQVAGVEVFYPRLRSVPRTGKRSNPPVEPLFPCYLFARFPLVPLLERVRNAAGVRYVVGFANVCSAIPEADMDELRRGFGANETMERPTPRLQPGTEVDVISGPFKGFRAVVHFDLPSAQRVQVLLDLVRRATLVEMDLRDVEIPRPFPGPLRRDFPPVE